MAEHGDRAADQREIPGLTGDFRGDCAEQMASSGRTRAAFIQGGSRIATTPTAGTAPHSAGYGDGRETAGWSLTGTEGEAVLRVGLAGWPIPQTPAPRIPGRRCRCVTSA